MSNTRCAHGERESMDCCAAACEVYTASNCAAYRWRHSVSAHIPKKPTGGRPGPAHATSRVRSVQASGIAAVTDVLICKKRRAHGTINMCLCSGLNGTSCVCEVFTVSCGKQSRVITYFVCAVRQKQALFNPARFALTEHYMRNGGAFLKTRSALMGSFVKSAVYFLQKKGP